MSGGGGNPNKFKTVEHIGGVLRKLIRLVVLAALFVASGILHPAAAKADEVMGPPHPSPKRLSVVQLGDSFSAGNGAGSYLRCGVVRTQLQELGTTVRGISELPRY